VLCFQPYGFKADIWSIGILAFYMLTAGYYLLSTNLKNYDKEVIMKMIKDHL
jgi:serine/threonine protein kinase